MGYDRIKEIVDNIKQMEVAIRNARITGDREYAEELEAELEKLRRELKGK